MIYVLEISGQSNGEGRVSYTNLPSDYSGYLDSLKFWTGSTFEVLQIDASNQWNMATGTGEFAFQHILRKLGRFFGELYVVPTAMGGAGLADSYNEWYPGDTTYTTWDTNITAVNTWFSDRGLDYKLIRTWQQGEADAQNTTNANAYGTNFDTWRTSTNARYTALGVDFGGYLVCPLIDAFDQIGTAAVQSAQAAAASTHSDVHNIDNSGLSIFDVAHYDLASNELIGERFMRKALELWGFNQVL